MGTWSVVQTDFVFGPSSTMRKLLSCECSAGVPPRHKTRRFTNAQSSNFKERNVELCRSIQLSWQAAVNPRPRCSSDSRHGKKEPRVAKSPVNVSDVKTPASDGEMSQSPCRWFGPKPRRTTNCPICRALPFSSAQSYRSSSKEEVTGLSVRISVPDSRAHQA